MKRFWQWTCFSLIAFGGFSARAQTNSAPAAGLQPRPASVFQKGKWEMNLNGGALFSPAIDPAHRHPVNYSCFGLQAGCMLDSPPAAGWLPGNFEAVGELFGGDIFQGRGTYVTGTTAWLRYNFVPRASRFVPYAQLGAGFVLTDVDRRIENQNFNLNGEVGLGCRYFLHPDCSVNLEFRYQHISNGGMSRPNVGINAAGPILGLSWFF